MRRVTMLLGLILATIMILPTILSNNTSSQNHRKRSATMAETQHQYSSLVNRIINDIERNPTLKLLSTRHFSTHPDYPKLLQLGKRIVPLAVKDLQEGYDYPLDLLDDLLPDVNLSKLYGRTDYKTSTKLHRAYWLQWWVEYGSTKDWIQYD